MTGDFSSELNNISRMLKNIQEEQKRHAELLNNQYDDLAEIKLCLVGNSQYGQDGLVKEVKAMKSDMDELKSLKTKWTGYVVALGTVVSIGVEYLKSKFH